MPLQTTHAAQDHATTSDVIVIGAGIAGLAAATELTQKGHSVVILEARERVGGRMWTNRDWAGVPLEMGAGWIEGMRGNPVAKLAKEFKVKTEVLGDDSVALYDEDGTRLSDEILEEIWEGFEYFLEFFEGAREEVSSDVPMDVVIEEFIRQEELDQYEIRALHFMMHSTVETDYATDPENLSFLYFDQDDGFDGEDGTVPDGYDSIPRKLAEGLDIRLGHVVQEIDYASNPATVKTSQGEFTSKVVLSTLPLGVLKKGSVRFSPRLSLEKQEAIKKLNMGVLQRTYLMFDRVFWDEDVDMIGYLSKKRGRWPTFVNVHKFSGEPILLAFTAGRFGRGVESLSENQVADDVMKVLKTIYGKEIPSPTKLLISRWGQDPYSEGAYSYLPPGTTGKEFEILAEPLSDRLFFAGESTTRTYPATVHGAYLSGTREAERIHKLLKR